jgi:hypothetical protein
VVERASASFSMFLFSERGIRLDFVVAAASWSAVWGVKPARGAKAEGVSWRVVCGQGLGGIIVGFWGFEWQI